MSAHPADAIGSCALCHFGGLGKKKKYDKLVYKALEKHLCGKKSRPLTKDTGKLTNQPGSRFAISTQVTCEKAGQLSGGIKRENPFTLRRAGSIDVRDAKRKKKNWWKQGGLPKWKSSLVAVTISNIWQKGTQTNKIKSLNIYLRAQISDECRCYQWDRNKLCVRAEAPQRYKEVLASLHSFAFLPYLNVWDSVIILLVNSLVSPLLESWVKIQKLNPGYLTCSIKRTLKKNPSDNMELNDLKKQQIVPWSSKIQE